MFIKLCLIVEKRAMLGMYGGPKNMSLFSTAFCLFSKKIMAFMHCIISVNIALKTLPQEKIHDKVVIMLLKKLIMSLQYSGLECIKIR